MKRCSIIIHSVTGNCFTMGMHLKEELEKRSVDARLYRVEDDDLHILANENEAVNNCYEDIMELPIATAEKLVKSDMVVLGCPSVFGNVTAEMKAFIDGTIQMCKDKALADKFFACFTTSRQSVFEGARTLDTLIYWAQNMGMLHIPFGIHDELPLCNQPVQGIVHCEGKEGLISPAQQIGNEIEAYAEDLASYIQE